MQKAVPWGRIQAKDVKGQPKDTPTFSAKANGQIKGVVDVGNDHVNCYQNVIPTRKPYYGRQ